MFPTTTSPSQLSDPQWIVLQSDIRGASRIEESIYNLDGARKTSHIIVSNFCPRRSTLEIGKIKFGHAERGISWDSQNM